MTLETLILEKAKKIPIKRAPVLKKSDPRPSVGGKFLFSGRRKLYIRGVTYGPFHPDSQGCEYRDPDMVERDFSQMAANGINSVRTYTLPPVWLLDIAKRHGILVMVGIAWEQHITFLDDPKRVRAIEEHVRQSVRRYAGHPAILCYAIGNEIPPPIVRWYGRKRIEKFIKKLFLAAKAEDPQGLVSYVNYPTTEYLQLPFIDFVCFNVYLESQTTFQAYLARLQNIAGDKPLVMAEIGLDSHMNGQEAQTRSLEWQVRSAFAEGCAGVFVFAWTDEWYRGGYDIEDWDFGLTTRDRQPKLALEAVREVFAQTPFSKNINWPKISVVVCSYNGSRTIRECCEGLTLLQYPNYEVVVVNDGSTDKTPEIVREYGFRMISTENRGLSSARNTGMEAATGEIIAYIDDDASPDPHWLQYLAAAFMNSSFAAIGGPNIAPPDKGIVADCVANAPGGPCHVLLSDRMAEHIPGCNMAFRKKDLQAVGGFDPQYRSAGDDVDVCWRIQQSGRVIGFSHAAMVWHHRRNSIRMFWKQQRGYGRAEALLERKWPEKYNLVGHLFWAGRIYGKGLTEPLGFRRWRVYHGVWGSALFQSMYQNVPSSLLSVPLMPEWYFVVSTLMGVSLLGFFIWKPLFLTASILLVFAIGATLAQAVLSAQKSLFTTLDQSRSTQFKLYALTTVMHLMQPLARLWGRISYGLTPWRRDWEAGLHSPWPNDLSIWFEEWRSSVERLRTIESILQAHRTMVLSGGDFDNWDLEVWAGMLGGLRLFMTVEEHGGGRQLVRFRIRPKFSFVALLLISIFGAISLLAVLDGAMAAFIIFALITLLFAQRAILECSNVTALARRVLKQYAGGMEVKKKR